MSAASPPPLASPAAALVSRAVGQDDDGETSAAKFVELRTPTTSARVSLTGAQVMSFVAGDGLGEVLWTGPYRIIPGKDCWGGIPLCWPWFMTGGGESPLLPFHGPARFATWESQAPRENMDGTVGVSLHLPRGVVAADGRALPLEAWLDITLGRSLRLQLTTRNTGTTTFRLEHCFHAYFLVGDVTQTTLHGLAATEVVDQLAPTPVERHVTGVVRPGSPASQIYRPCPRMLAIKDPVLDRCITLRSSHARQLVVWNSGPVRMVNGRSTGEDEWRTQLAIEPLRGLEDALSLAPGASAVLDLEIAASPLHDDG